MIRLSLSLSLSLSRACCRRGRGRDSLSPRCAATHLSDGAYQQAESQLPILIAWSRHMYISLSDMSPPSVIRPIHRQNSLRVSIAHTCQQLCDSLILSYSRSEHNSAAIFCGTLIARQSLSIYFCLRNVATFSLRSPTSSSAMSTVCTHPASGRLSNSTSVSSAATRRLQSTVALHNL
ncbi:hypothetical protein KP509_01G038000 [Ceratopteris richardii]|uniref:Uncharacterized protein n=1 Tax=Ceratopteris richardii TaxID=49495 RepID=A0A8T2VJW8_CERRI|nr:hypothetical protein KP509_01G038000 [Ceratopteris richardii]